MNILLPRILIIEDDEIVGGALVQRLRLEGFDPVWAKTRAEAIEAFKRGKPDFIVSDIVLPDGSGEDVYRQALPWLGGTRSSSPETEATAEQLRRVADTDLSVLITEKPERARKSRHATCTAFPVGHRSLSCP